MKESDILVLNASIFQLQHCSRNLKVHVENKHKGVRYSCSQCKYLATQAGDLKRHVENKHEGVRYPCSQC